MREINKEKYPAKIRQLMRISQEILNDQELLKFLWEKTSSPEYYDYLLEALRTLAQLRLYEWEK